jgi:signal transduction histidine kinase/putative methionine-R-sulfoxide reductase with GAF domain
MGIFSRPRSDELRSIDGVSDSILGSQEAIEATLRINEIASSAAPLPSAVRSMVRVAVQLLTANQGSIMLMDDTGRTLVLAASWGLPPEAAEHVRVNIGESVAGRVLATGKPLLLGKVDGEAFMNFIPKSKPISSSIVVPLRVQGEAIGVLNLAADDTRPPFSEDDLRLAQLFADQAAGIIHRARLHEKAEQRSSDLMALVESSKGLLGTLDLDSLLQRILDGGSRLAGGINGFACLFDSESENITRGVFRGVDKKVIGGVVQDENVKRAITTSDTVYFETPELGVVTAVGLRTSRGTKGVLVIQAERQFAEDRADLLRAFGQQCSSAIGSAELYSLIEHKESQLSSIIRGVPNPIVLVDDRGVIAAINPAAEQLFGVASVFSTGTAAVNELNNAEVEKMLTGEGELQGEVLVGSPPRTFRARVTDVQFASGPLGRVLIMDDVTTERENAQRQRDFVAMVGHELRTPLTIVKGFARTLMRRIGSASAEEAKEALATIDAKAGQLERLIEDLLYVSKIEAREASLRVEQVDVTALVNGVTSDILRHHEGREVILDMDHSILWPCDETKVAMVMRHLIENALKYSESPEPVTVKVLTDDEEMRVDVIDSGVGIVSSDIPHIFERFKQLDSSSTRSHGGTGVGLYLCAQLVRVHGGTITVDSMWGKGSTFTFTIPRRTTGQKVVHMYGPGGRKSA